MGAKAKPCKTVEPELDLDSVLESVEYTDDVVEYMFRCLLAMSPQFSDAVRQSAERHVREMFGGSRVYIARRGGDGTAERNAAIVRDYLKGERLSFLERRYQLSQRRILQIIKSGVSPT